MKCGHIRSDFALSLKSEANTNMKMEKQNKTPKHASISVKNQTWMGRSMRQVSPQLGWVQRCWGDGPHEDTHRTSTVARSNRFGRAIPALWLLFPCWHPSPPPWFIGGPTSKTRQRCSGRESPPFEQGTVTVSHHQITLSASLEKIRCWVKRPGRLGGKFPTWKPRQREIISSHHRSYNYS